MPNTEPSPDGKQANTLVPNADQTPPPPDTATAGETSSRTSPSGPPPETPAEVAPSVPEPAEAATNTKSDEGLLQQAARAIGEFMSRGQRPRTPAKQAISSPPPPPPADEPPADEREQ